MSINTEVLHVKCKKCKSWRLPEHFLNTTRRKLKTCIICRNRSQKARNKNKTNNTIKNNKTDNTTSELKAHIEKQFKPNMSWDNYGTIWNIGYITPLKYKNPSIEETYNRLSYLNTQPILI